jgi:3-oxoacyl-[acyl-carrier-protein] synthase-3
MAVFSISNIKIAGVSAVVPKNEVSNFDLKNMSDQDIQLLIKTTGIEKRRVSDSHVRTSDLCLSAAEKLILELKWKKEEIEILIFVTQTPDYQIPGTSMILQNKMGIPTTCMSFDINQGCAGYVYGLSVISSIMSASKMKKGLLLVGDTITQVLDQEDNSTVPIFSDAGSATAIEFDSNADNMHFNLQTDGSKYDSILMEENSHMKMNGHDIFNFGLKEVSPNIFGLLNHCQQSADEIDYIIFHQANKLLNEAIRKKLNFPNEKVPMTLSKYGNTSCATIPITIVSELQKEVQQKKLNLLLSGFGVGLSWGSAFISISNIKCPELIEI